MSAPKPLGYLHRTASPPIFITITPHADAMAEWMAVFERPVSVSNRDLVGLLMDDGLFGSRDGYRIDRITYALAALGIEVTP